MKSVQQMIQRCAGLIDTTDVNDWENEFLQSVVDREQSKQPITPKQTEIVERIYKKHFA